MNQPSPQTTAPQDAARIALGATLILAGTSHLTFARKPFKAQVPNWVPLDKDTVVLQSGIAEILLGSALIVLPALKPFPAAKPLIGGVAAAFFTAIFPGNVAQYTHRRNAFGLDTDRKRFVRLFFQPILIGWALWSTGSLERPNRKA